MKTLAVVVTFNRLELLKKVLEGLKAQTHRIDGIIVVNNDSTDGTGEWLETQENLDVINQENVGGAGGFKTGMERAYEAGADWIWVMDDDVFPRDDTLEMLISRGNISKCILPTRVFSDGEPCWWGYVFDIRRRSIVSGTRPREQDLSKKLFCVNTCCFEGMLIHRAIVEEVGFPDERFFISWDDTVYGLLASKFTNILIVGDALMVRAKTSAESTLVSPLFAYYHFRNFHLVGEYFGRLSGGKTYGLFGHLKYLLGSLLFLRSCWLTSRSTFRGVSRAVLRGILDSYRGKVGRTH